jgi:hypothetical protein
MSLALGLYELLSMLNGAPAAASESNVISQAQLIQWAYI